MPANSDKKNVSTIGYFTVVFDEQNGWTGGLLVLDRGGRPIEFQCTLPVRPTKAHGILFGPTLAAHIIGDVIGKTLIKKCRSRIHLLCCDLPEALALESHTSSPVALVRQAAEDDEGPISEDMVAGSETVEVAGSTFLVAMERVAEVERYADSYRDLPDAVEPFGRIREAIKEAHSQLARQNSEAA